jgi:putative peptidoglycan lipid II flippase
LDEGTASRPNEGKSPGTARVTRDATVFGLATLLSRFFGLARDSVFAVLFGTGFVADAFNLAFMVPSFFRRVVGEGNFNPAFVPVFAQIWQKRGPEDAKEFFRRVTGVFLVVLGVMTLLGMLLAEPLVRLYAHDWKQHPEDLRFAVLLLQIMFPFLFFSGGAALVSAALNARGKFLVSALAPILLNVCFLLGAAGAFFTESIHTRAILFTIAGCLGGLASWVCMFPEMRTLGLPLSLKWAPKDPDVRRVGALMLPGFLALGVTQVNSLVDTMVALRMEAGTLSALRLGNRVTLLPVGVIGVAVSTASLSMMSRRAAEGDRKGLLETLDHTLRLLVTLLVPATVGLVLLAEPIVRLLFQYGEFTASQSTPMTTAALVFYAVGLPGYGLVRGLAQAYYAMQDTKTPVRIGAVSVVANIVFILLLMKPMKLAGLALATSLASYVNAGLLFALLPKRVGAYSPRALLLSTARTFAGSAVLGVAALGGAALAPYLLPGDSIAARIAVVGLAIAFGLVGLVVTLRALGHEELREIQTALTARRWGGPRRPAS